MLLACFAWLVGLLCACGVRRFYGLLRVCPSFVLSFVLSFVFFLVLLLLLSLLVLLSSLLALFVLVSLWFVFVVSLSLTDE